MANVLPAYAGMSPALAGYVVDVESAPRLRGDEPLRTGPVVERPSAPVPMPDVDPDDVEAWVAAMEARRG